jgi:hypothetical protein
VVADRPAANLGLAGAPSVATRSNLTNENVQTILLDGFLRKCLEAVHVQYPHSAVSDLYEILRYQFAARALKCRNGHREHLGQFWLRQLDPAVGRASAIVLGEQTTGHPLR